MSNFVESLESRMFLSVSPAVATLRTDEAAAKPDVAALKAEGATVVKTIAADLKAAGLQVTDRAQFKAFSSAMAKVAGGDRSALAAATSKVNAAVNKLESAEAQLAKKPGNAKLTAKVSADQTALTTIASNELSAFNTANDGAAVVPAIQALIGDGGTVGTDASSGLTALGNDAGSLGSAAAQAFSTDVSAIVGP